MKLEYFPHFLKINYPSSDFKESEARELGEAFKIYLEKTFEGKENVMKAIWDIHPIKIIAQRHHPLKVNGYEPALVLHFKQFLDSILKK